MKDEQYGALSMAEVENDSESRGSSNDHTINATSYGLSAHIVDNRIIPSTECQGNHYTTTSVQHKIELSRMTPILNFRSTSA